MRSTGTEYASTEVTPVVLPEMAQLLPPLTGEQRSALEADLLANGCYSPIIVNEDMVIVDGHHRYALCEEHSIPYKMAVFAFADLLEAKSPYSERITAADSAPIPGMERMGGLIPQIQSSICRSNSSTLESS